MERDVSYEIIGAAIDVHRELGPGLLESAYEQCLAHEMNMRGLAFERQKIIPVIYKGIAIDCGFRLDFLVANQVIVELTSVDRLIPLHEAQLLTYLKLTGCTLGLLLNFNTTRLTYGIKRIIYTP